MNNWCQHAIKNIGQKVLNLNDITFNNRLGNLIGRCFEMPYVSYCHPLAVIKTDFSVMCKKDDLETVTLKCREKVVNKTK